MATTTPAAPPAEVVAPADRRLRAVHTRTAAFGFLLAGIGMLVLLTAFALFEPEILMGFLPFLVIIAVAGALVWRFGTWAKVIGAVVGLGMLAMFGPHLAGTLAWPYSFLDFAPSVLVIVGLALGGGGSVAAIVRRKHRAAAATPLERTIRTWATVVVVAAVVVSGVWSAATWGSGTAAADGSLAVEIEAGQFAGAPYEIPAGETITFAVHNNDPWVHTFTIPELGIDELLRPGASVTVDATAPAGTYTLYCKPHADMNEPDPAKAGMAASVVAR